MKATLDVNFRKFEADLKRLWGTETKRTAEEFINGQAEFVARQALYSTAVTDAARIRSELEQTVQQLSTDDPATVAERILGKRFQKYGTLGITKGRSIKAKARELIASRVRSRAFIKSGWLPAIRIFHQFRTGAVSGLAGARIYGRPKGSGKVARFGLFDKAFASITNSALLAVRKFSDQRSNPLPVAERALRAGLLLARRSMNRKFRERLMRQYKKFGANVK